MIPALAPAVALVPGEARLSIASIFHPFDKQVQFLTARNRRRFFCAGRGAGKSRTLVLDAMLRTLANGPVRSGLLGRTQDEVEQVLLPYLTEHAEAMREATGIYPIERIIAGEHRAIFRGGGSLEWRGYEQADKIRSRNFAAVWLDEVCWAQIDDEALWKAVLPTVRVLAPLGGIAVASSPNGMRGITKWFRDAQDRRDTRWHVTRCTSYDNPYLDRDIIEDWKASMSKSAFQQEVLALALRPSSVIFSQYDEQRHRIRYDWQHAPMASKWVVGVDWGMSHAAAVIAVVEPDGRWVIVDELIDEPQSYLAYRDKLFAWVERYTGREGPHLAVGDRAVTHEQLKMRERWRDRLVLGMDSRKEQSIRTGIGMIQAMLEPASGEPRLFLSDLMERTSVGTTKGLRAAFESYQWWLNADGVATDRPRKDDSSDHVIDALRYAVVGSAARSEYHGGRTMLR